MNELAAIAFCCFVSLVTSVLVMNSITKTDNDWLDPVDESNINYLKKRSSENAGAETKPDAVN